jgi:hypothetical protein
MFIGASIDDAFARGQTVAFTNGITARLLRREFASVVDDAATLASRNAATRVGEVLGVAGSGIIGFGIQGAVDFNNPYLTATQKWQRATVSGLLSFGASVGGLLVAGAFGGPAGLGAAFLLGAVLEYWGAPVLFEVVDALPSRDLAPLSP